MTSGRYEDRIRARNSNPLYRNYLKNSRGISQIRQYGTPTFHYPSVGDIMNLTSTSHTWKLGDRYYKLAYEHYGDPEVWWVIAMYNKKPTEAFVNVGDRIYIPKPIDIVIQHFMTSE